MFSKSDINKELGKGINIYPFNEKNIKENSINLTASKYAWSIKEGEVFINSKGEFCSSDEEKCKKISIYKGKNCVKKINKKKYIILLPSSTTLVETKEVLGLNNNIGGTYHSKVGIASLGVGHIGTMVGPNFCGHSLIAIHNILDYPLKISVDDTIVSVIFYYLNTPGNNKNTTVGGHIEKMAQFGINLTKEESDYLTEDWKSEINKIRNKMNKSDEFESYKEDLKDINKYEEEDNNNQTKSYMKNILSKIIKFIKQYKIIVVILGFLVFFYILAHLLDEGNGNSNYIDFYSKVAFPVIISVMLQPALSKMNKSKE